MLMHQKFDLDRIYLQKDNLKFIQLIHDGVHKLTQEILRYVSTAVLMVDKESPCFFCIITWSKQITHSFKMHSCRST